MKKKVFLLFLSLCFILNMNIVSADNIVSAEFELAYKLIENYKNNNLTKEIQYEDGVHLRKVLYFVMSVIPEKVKLQMKTLTQNNSTTNYISLEISDKRYEDARKVGKDIANSILIPQMTFKDKVKISHDCIIKNCTYDKAADPNAEDMSAYSISGVFLDKKAVCDGYTGAMMSLLNNASIPCFRIVSKTMNHSFNAVYDGTLFYFVDATHDDPISDVSERVSSRFLMLSHSQLIKQGHQFDQSSEETVSYEEFIEFFKFYLKKIGYEKTENDEKTINQNMTNVLSMLGILNNTQTDQFLSYVRLITGKKISFFNDKITPPLITRDYANELFKNLGFRDLNGNFYWYTTTQNTINNNIKFLNSYIPDIFHAMFSQISKEEFEILTKLLNEKNSETEAAKLLISYFGVDTK